MKSRNLPDVIGIRTNGKIDAWEVESSTDNALELYDRLQQQMNTLPEQQRGTIKVLRPQGIVKDMQAATNNGQAFGENSRRRGTGIPEINSQDLKLLTGVNWRLGNVCYEFSRRDI